MAESESEVVQSCPTLCEPMNCSTPGLPVHHQLPEFTQTHVHPVGDAIQPSHPLSSPSPPAPNPSQHQGSFPASQLFAWGSQSIGVSASVSLLPMNTQDWSPLRWTGWISVTIVMIIKHPSKPYSILNALHTYINSFNSHNNPMVCVLLLLPLYEWHNCSEIWSSLKGTTSRWYP